MRKITFLFLFFVCISYGQKNDVVTSKIVNEAISFEQYDFLKKINSFYPEVVVSKNVKNSYLVGTNKKIMPSFVVCDLPADYKVYELRIGQSNLNMDYQFKSVDGGVSYGSYNVMGNYVFKTEYYLKADFKITRFYRNGKLLYSDSPENEVIN